MRSSSFTYRSLGVAFAAAISALLMAPASASAQNERRPTVSAGKQKSKTPLVKNFGARLTSRLENISIVTADGDGNEWEPNLAFNSQLRVSASYDSDRQFSWARVRLNYEHDFLSGVVSGGESGLVGVHVPKTDGYDEHALRKLSATISFDKYLTVAGGFMTSHWGLGLLANDGAHGWTAGSGRFSDPRGGDRVLRALLATGPHTEQSLRIFAAIDMVRDDDVLLEGDEAVQVVGGLTLGTGKPWTAGLYGVYRMQEASDGQETNVAVMDVFAAYRHNLTQGHSLKFEFEGAVIFGETDLAPSNDFPKHDVLQLGAALRVTYDAPLGGVVLDVLYASGDQNFDDKSQNGFKADVNFDTGMLFYRQIMAAQTARSPINASDPNLVGVPNEDLDRFPTRGNPTNTIAIYPRGYVRPMDGLEFYGGILIALAEVAYADPLNTRLAGGDPRNPLNGDPGVLYGTEFDLGGSFQTLLWGTQLTFAAEGAVFLPGDAMVGPNDLGSDPIYGGRVSLTWEL
ncbi:MAG: hypothetical protein ACI9OJ_002187 [Myxococcota bacterium]|jgi:hypothetical protein